MSDQRLDRHRARERVQRVLYMATGFGGMIFGGLLAGKISHQMMEVQPLFGWSAFAVGILIPASFTILAWTLPLRVLNMIAAGTVSAFVLLQLLWLPAMTVTELAKHDAPWMWGVNATHAVMVAILTRKNTAFLYAAIQGPIVGLVGFAATGNELRLSLLDGVGAIVFCTILIGASLALIQASEQQDLVAARTRAQASIEAIKRTREREQARINAIVHDDIISVLLVASRDQPSRRLAEQAESALASIATLSVDSDEVQDYERAEAIAALRTAVTDTAPNVDFWHSSSGETPIPARVIEALTEATAEAVRNSVIHAGTEGEYVHRVVTVNITDGAIRATIQDSGRGFNMRTVNDRRLGIRVSIYERMRLLPGGSANVESRPGRGTTVTLGWVKPR
ncbi:MAG: ATP-binding protein [Demequinaceae bacterium]|nr:ATP-binding protein [Demequinaceae bacterium]